MYEILYREKFLIFPSFFFKGTYFGDQFTSVNRDYFQKKKQREMNSKFNEHG